MFPLFPSEDSGNLPLPLVVAQNWQFSLQHHVVDGEYWFSIQDWISGLAATDTVKASEMWRKMDKLQNRISTTSLSYNAKDGKIYQREFTNDHGLYLIAQTLRVTKERTVLGQIKEFLAKSGAFVDSVRLEPQTVITSGAIDPDEALEAVVEYYRRQGKDDGWINARLTGIISRHQFTSALKAAIVDLLKSHYAIATNEVYLGLWQRTAQQLKEELNLTTRQKLRDHQPELGLLYQSLAEAACARKLGTQQELTFADGCVIIREVAELIGLQAAATSRYLGMDVATGKPLLASGI